MSLGRKDIVKNISTKAQISSKTAKLFLNRFIDQITLNVFKNSIKISNFGTFYIHNAPRRLGRNPKTKEEFLIKERKKVSFISSKKTKDLLN